MTTETLEVTSMKIKQGTIDLLKNFSTINSNMLIRTGNKITTISPVKNIVAEATVSETFPTEFGVWDLNKLLGTISLFDDADFSFDEKFMTISGKGGSSVKYYYCEPRLLTVLDKEIKMPEGVVSFELTQKMFNEIQKAASVLQLPDMCLRTESGSIELVVLDKQDSTSNNYSINVGPAEDNQDFCFYFKVENLKLLPGDYDVVVSDGVVSQFTSKSSDLRYWIALESDSVYNR